VPDVMRAAEPEPGLVFVACTQQGRGAARSIVAVRLTSDSSGRIARDSPAFKEAKQTVRVSAWCAAASWTVGCTAVSG